MLSLLFQKYALLFPQLLHLLLLVVATDDFVGQQLDLLVIFEDLQIILAGEPASAG